VKWVELTLRSDGLGTAKNLPRIDNRKLALGLSEPPTSGSSFAARPLFPQFHFNSNAGSRIILRWHFWYWSIFQMRTTSFLKEQVTALHLTLGTSDSCHYPHNGKKCLQIWALVLSSDLNIHEISDLTYALGQIPTVMGIQVKKKTKL